MITKRRGSLCRLRIDRPPQIVSFPSVKRFWWRLFPDPYPVIDLRAIGSHVS